MALRPTLSLRQTQKQAVTQKMQQSVAILAMSNSQLTEFLRKEQVDNPLLVLTEPPLSTPVATGIAAGNVIEEMVASQESLLAGLLRQLSAMDISQTHYQATSTLIGDLNSKGFLDQSLEDIASTYEISMADCQAGLTILQRFEPTGVGARNVPECLELQLRASGHWSNDYASLLQLLAKNTTRAENFAAVLGLSQAEVDRMLQTIQSLPLDFSDESIAGTAQHIIPDVLVHTEENGQVSVALNENAFPKLRVDSTFLGEEFSKSNDVEAYINQHSARVHWLRNAMEKRAATILRICITISETQSAYFENGPLELVPQKMKQAAQRLKIHESTVSRAIAGKYIACKWGTLPIHYFFTPAISRPDGQGISTTIVRARIRQLIEAETPNHILSDAKIAEILALESITVARRTIAKYRRDMNVPTSSVRRIHKRNDTRS